MTKRSRRGFILMALGALFLAAAIGFELYNDWQDNQAGKAAQALLATARKEMTGPAPSISASGGKTISINANTMVTKGGLIGVLNIPALGVTLPVQHDYSLEALDTSPCRFTGDGRLSRLVICGHNYKRFFGRLKNLKKGDAVTLTDMDGHVYRFAVSGQLVVAANDWNALETGSWDMTLFTCTVGGLRRVLVRCTLMG